MGGGTGLGGCHSCIKYLMFAFNFIFWLIGCALVGVGIWIMVDDGFKELAKENNFLFLQYAGIALIVVGGIIMLVGFFGCCGAIRESQCLLVMFFICMLLLFLVLVAAGVSIIVFKDLVIVAAVAPFEKAVDNYPDGASEGYVDLIQSFFECCGKKNSLDYPITGIPESCALLNYAKGCSKAVPEKLGSNVILVAGVALGSGAVMLLGMIFSMMLCCAIRDVE